ncbi:MAG: class I SAM-dependent methyltransferase [Candidatus Zixiibacteriota bacterium]
MTAHYEPDSYWEARGGEGYRAYVNSPEYAVYREEQARFFAALVAELHPRTLLDFGCGTGKLFPLWQDVPEVHGYDRSRSQLAVADGEARRLRPDRPYHLMCGIGSVRTRLPYDDSHFDLVVAAEVLLHVVPDEIGALVADLHRICRGTLAIVTAAPFDDPAPHNFNHDYDALLRRPPWRVASDHVRHAQRYIVARRSNPATVTTPERESAHAVVTP